MDKYDTPIQQHSSLIIMHYQLFQRNWLAQRVEEGFCPGITADVRIIFIP